MDIRPLTPADSTALTALIAACELEALGEVEIDEDEVIADWQRPTLDFVAHTRGFFQDGELIACMEVYIGGRAEGFVSPAHRGKGLGSALLTWSQGVAREGGAHKVGQSVPDTSPDAAALFRAHDYEPLYTSWQLTIALAGEPSPPALPAGYRIRDYVPGGPDEEAAYRVIEDAFNEWSGREPMPFGDWAAGSVRRAGFEPSQLPLLVTGAGPQEQVVGAGVLLHYPQEAWVQQLAVERSYRGRGLARALLQHAFGVSWRHGHRTCGLSTDSRTGALGLYEHVGMRVRRSYTHFSKQV